MDKKCTRCNHIKNVELFDRKTENKTDGRKSWCKECASKHGKAVWSAYKRDKDHEALSASPEKFLKHWLLKVRGKMFGRQRHQVHEDLTLQDLLDLWKKQDGKCAQTGIPMTHLKGAGIIDTNVSVDRIDNNIKEYNKNNIQLVCYRYNMMKHNQQEKHLKTWCKAILDYSK
tara:strand:- start:398 stop:913 length:516 start_codon:yes stop_codon:yes gene_type:complete